MKNVIDKLAVIFIVSLFALSGVTAGYAMWSQDLTIKGTVETGTLDWEFVPLLKVEDSSCPPSYYPTQTPDYNCDPNYGFYEPSDGEGWGPQLSDKNVGCGTLNQVDAHTLAVVINNAYPGYWNGVQTHVHCSGSIPIKIQEVVFSWDAAGTDVFLTINALNEFDIFHINLDGDNNPEMELKWGDNFGKQLHYCQTAEISFDFCFLQTLEQLQRYTFYITLTAVQWNEYVAP